MTISAIIITLVSDPSRRYRALAGLLAFEQLTLGPREGLRIPAVLETDSLRSSRDLVESLQSRPGIERVDVVEVHFEDDADLAGTPPTDRN